jgi:predicted RND superfamily exporter protein
MRSVGPVHSRVEAGFRALGDLCCRQSWPVIAGCLLIAGLLIAGLPSITADFANDSYLLPGDDARQRYDAFRDRFGLDDRIVVALEPENVFDLEFLETLRRLHREIEREIPHVEEVLSLVNARNTRGEDDELIVEDLLEDWPESHGDLSALREKVLANPTYRNVLISEDGRYTVILVRAETYSSLGLEDDALEGFDAEARGDDAGPPGAAYLTGYESDQLVNALYELIARYQSEDLPIRLAGESVLGYRASEIASQDTVIFGLLSLLVMVLILFLLFRRISAGLLPALVVLLSIASTFGAMAWLGVPFSIPTQILPNFLIAVGVCDSVHILAIFFQGFERGDSRREAVVYAMGHSGLAVLLTSLTTAGGLLSFLAAEITPVTRLGLIAPVGVLITLFFTMTLLPALLAVVPIARRGGESNTAPEQGSDEQQEGPLTRILVWIGVGSAEHPRAVLAVAAALVLVATSGVANLRFSHDPFDWLLEDDPVRIAVARMDRALRGVSTVEILIDTGEENGLYDPETLRRIESATDFARSIDEEPVPVGTVVSILDIVKEINRALNANAPRFYSLPGERELIAQELLLFENSGSDDLLQVTDSRFRVARLTLRVPLADGFFYGPFLERLEAGVAERLGPDLRFEMTGATVLGSRAFSVVITSMARSYGLALLIITPLMILMMGSLRIGLVSMLPNLFPVYLTLALMGWLDIALGISTLMVGSIIIGLAVDDTIHFLHKFDRYYQSGDEPRRAVRKTLETTGRALLVTSIVLIFSFGVFAFGRMTGVVQFGLIVTFGTAVAFLADITISPALLVLVTRPQGSRDEPSVATSRESFT